MKFKTVTLAALALALAAGAARADNMFTRFPPLPGGPQPGDITWVVRNGVDYSNIYAAPTSFSGTFAGSLTGTVNGVTLQGTGSATQFLNAAGQYVTVSGGGQSYTNGTGLALAGNAFSVVYGTGPSTAAQGNDSRFALAATALQPGAVIPLANISGAGSAAAANVTAFLQPSNNLADLASPATARTNLGLGSAATFASTAFAQAANNLSDLASAATARLNLGLGSLATQSAVTAAQLPTLTGDVSNNASGVTTVNAIKGVTVAGTTGTGNNVFSASPTLTGTLNAGTGVFTGAVTAPGFTGPLAGNASTATALASPPSACTGGQFATGISANGTPTCATPATGGTAGITQLTGDVTTPANSSGSTAATLASVGTPGTYGSASSVNTITTDAKGRVTGVVNNPIAIGVAQVTGAAPLASPAHTGTATVNNTAGAVPALPSGTLLGLYGSSGFAARGIAIGSDLPGMWTTARNSAAAMGAGTQLGSFNAGGYDGSTLATGVAAIVPYTGEAWSSTAHGTGWRFDVNPLGTTSLLTNAVTIAPSGLFSANYGAAITGALNAVTGAFSSTLSAGATTLASLGVTGNQTVGGTLGVTGSATLGTTSIGNLQLPNSAAHAIPVAQAGAGVTYVPVGTSGYPLLSGGSAADPAYGALNLANATAGVLGVGQGGTGASTTTAALDSLLGTSSTALNATVPYRRYSSTNAAPIYGFANNYLTSNDIYNLPHLRKCLAKVRAGTGRCFGVLAGDSTEIGVNGAGVAQWPNEGSYIASYLTAMGLPTHQSGFSGNSSYGTGSRSGVDSRIALGGFAPDNFSVTGGTLGGDWLSASATGSPLSWTYTTPTDTCKFWWTIATTATISLQEGSGSVVAPAAGTSGSVQTATATGPLAVNSCKVSWTGGSAKAFATAFLQYDSTQPGIDLMNAGWWGAYMSQIANNSANYNSLNALKAIAPDFVILKSTINDAASGGVTAAVYKTQLTNFVSTIQAAGIDVVLETDNPANTTNSQTNYIDAIYQVAATYSVPVINNYSSYGGSYSYISSTLGFMSDGYHPYTTGYSDQALYVAQFIASIAAPAGGQAVNAIPYTLDINDKEMMRVTTTGSVGIGSSSPLSALDLSQKTDALALPVGTTGQRPAPASQGMLRYNTTTGGLETYSGTSWGVVGGSGGVTFPAAGSAVISTGASSTPSGVAEVDGSCLVGVGGAWSAGSCSTGSNAFGSSAAATSPQRSGDATTGFFSGTAGTISAASAGNEIARISGNGLALGTSYVGVTPPVNGAIIQGSTGIGTTAPAAFVDIQEGSYPGLGLRVLGSVASSTSFSVGNTTSSSWNFSVNGSGSTPVGLFSFYNSASGYNAFNLTTGGQIFVPSGGQYAFYSTATGRGGSVTSAFSQLSSNKVALGNGGAADYSGTLLVGNIGIGTNAPQATLDVRGLTSANGVYSIGTTFTASGCSITGLAGGATVGKFLSGTSGTCTVTITLPTAPTGWHCKADDETTGVRLNTTADTTTSCTVSGSTTSGDKIVFDAIGY